MFSEFGLTFCWTWCPNLKKWLNYLRLFFYKDIFDIFHIFGNSDFPKLGTFSDSNWCSHTHTHTDTHTITELTSLFLIFQQFHFKIWTSRQKAKEIYSITSYIFTMIYLYGENYKKCKNTKNTKILMELLTEWKYHISLLREMILW